jgi:hypothetical protein
MGSTYSRRLAAEVAKLNEKMEAKAQEEAEAVAARADRDDR